MVIWVDDPLPRGLTPIGFNVPDEPDAPTDAEIFGAAFGLENDVVNFFTVMEQRAQVFRPDADPSAWMEADWFQNTKYDQDYLSYFVGVRSEAEARSLMSQIDREEHNRDVMARGGAMGLLATIAAGGLSPTMLIPIAGWYGTVAKAGRAARIASGAAGASASGALAVGLQEGVLQSSQVLRTTAESVFNIAGGAIITGMLGGAIAGLTRQQVSALASRINDIPASIAEEAALLTRLIDGDVPARGVAPEDIDARLNELVSEIEARQAALPPEKRTLGPEIADATERAEIAKGVLPHLDSASELPSGGALSRLVVEAMQAAEFMPGAARAFLLTAKRAAQKLSADGNVAAGKLLQDIEAQLDALPESAGGAGVGAAVSGSDRGPGIVASALGAEKAFARFSPLTRTMSSRFTETHDAARDLVELPFNLVENAQGIATTIGGSVEGRAKFMGEAQLGTFIEKLDAAFQQYFLGKPGRFAALRSEVHRLIGRGNDKMTFTEFKEAVHEASIADGAHAVPEVRDAAKAWRELSDNLREEALRERMPGFKEAVDRFLEEGLDPGYVGRYYDVPKIKANTPAFIDLLTQWSIARQGALAKHTEGLEAKVGEKQVEIETGTERLRAEVQAFAERQRDLRAERRAAAADTGAAGKPLQAAERDLAKEQARLAKQADAEQKSFYKFLLADLKRGRPKAQGQELAAFIREQGGIRRFDLDAVGGQVRDASRSAELASILDGAVRMKFIRKDGLDLDNMLTLAIDAGYLDPGASLDDLLEAIGKSASGQPVFSRLDADIVKAQDEIAALLREIDEAGLDPAKMSVDDLRSFLLGETGDATITREGVVFSDTREAGEQFHGTSGGLSPSDVHYTSANYYGQGLYTTDAVDVAYGYSKRGAKASEARSLYRIEPRAGLNIIDAEAPLTDDIVTALKPAEGGSEIDDFILDAFEEATTLRGLYDEIRDASASAGLSTDTVQDIFDGFSGDLQKLGINGIEHIGGQRTGTPAHKVVIYFNPEADVVVTKLPFDEFKAAAAGEKVPGVGPRSPETQRIASEIEALAARFDEAALRLEDMEAAIRAADEFAPEVAASARSIKASMREAQVEINKLNRIIAKRRQTADLSPDELRSIAEETTDTIIGLSPGRLALPQDLNVGLRGPAKARTLHIPTSLIRDFVERDIEVLARIATRTMAMDTAFMHKFGSIDMAEQFQKIKDRGHTENRNLEGSNTLSKEEISKRTAQNNKQVADDIRDLKGMRDRLRGTYALPDYPEGLLHRTSTVLRNVNYMRLLGGMTLSAIPDLARPVMVHGMTRTFGTAFHPLFHGLATFKLSMREALLAGTAWDNALDTRTMRIADINDDYGRGSKFERGLTVATRKFGFVSLMAPWNAFMKQFVGVIVQTRMLQAIERVVAGKATQKEINYLAAGNINADIAERIWKQFDRPGVGVREGVGDGAVWWANTLEWTDRQAIEGFRSLMVRDIDRTIVTPGQDLPLWISRPVGRVVGQFKQFQIASVQRTMISGLQQRDMATLNGVLMSLALGAGVYWIKDTIAGRTISDDPTKWAVEAFDRSGLSGWLMEANNFLEKFTGGRVGTSVLTGQVSSRFASRNIWGAALGPSFDLLGNLGQLGRAISTGEWTQTDIRALRRLIPLQNIFYIRSLFDAAESGVSNAFGISATTGSGARSITQ